MYIEFAILMNRFPIASCFYHFDQSGNVYISEADRWSNLNFDHRGAGEFWGRAATGTKIGGSQESNMPLVNVTNPLHAEGGLGYIVKRPQGAQRRESRGKQKKKLLILMRRYC